MYLFGVATVNHGVREHHNLDDVPAAGAPNADAPAVGEFRNSLIIESELIDAVGAVEESDAGSRWNA